MSYEIVYNSQFIKTNEGKIIPLVLHGSSNCIELISSHPRRRVRCWSAMYFNGQNEAIDKTESEIIERIESYVGDSYQAHFQRNSKWVDDKGLIRFFKSGIKKAKTIEELQEKYRNCDVLQGYYSVWEGSRNIIENRTYITNSLELEKFLLGAKQRINNRNNNEYVYIQLEFACEKLEPKVNQYYVITIDRLSYLTKMTSDSIQYTRDLSDGVKQFKTEKSVIKYIEKIKQQDFDCELGYKYITAQ